MKQISGGALVKTTALFNVPIKEGKVFSNKQRGGEEGGMPLVKTTVLFNVPIKEGRCTAHATAGAETLFFKTGAAGLPQNYRKRTPDTSGTGDIGGEAQAYLGAPTGKKNRNNLGSPNFGGLGSTHGSRPSWGMGAARSEDRTHEQWRAGEK
ncbi:hypothetical protein B0H17DRAFT_1126850 [Mycena rosella]|uniref:Uncharacterized protein n=1 Tax=Mycena rosella TaxID=1033263 RepID=A0AAD7GSU8_MYCRO|nr:hypothetical protein B0H17DRAFT_1126850 [Mycena rosella]